MTIQKLASTIQETTNSFFHCSFSQDESPQTPEVRMIIGSITERLQRETGAQATAVFLTTAEDPSKLSYFGGAGYKKDYDGFQYFLRGKNLTSWVHTHGVEIVAGKYRQLGIEFGINKGANELKKL